MVIGLSEEDEDDLFQQPRRPLRPVRPNRSKRSTKSAGGSRGGAGKRQRSGGEAGEAGSSVAKPCTHGGLSTANPRALKTGSMVGGHLPQSASPYERLTTSQVRAFFSSAPPGTGQHRSRTSDPYQPHQGRVDGCLDRQASEVFEGLITLDDDGEPAEELLSEPEEMTQMEPGGDDGIASWLSSLGLSCHLPNFLREEVDLDALPHLSDKDLQDLGVADDEQRRLVLQEAAALSGHGGSAARPRDASDPSASGGEFPPAGPSTPGGHRCSAEEAKSFFRARFKQAPAFQRLQPPCPPAASKQHRGGWQRPAAGHRSVTACRLDAPGSGPRREHRLVPGTSFIVDGFTRDLAAQPCRHWFLTHFHSDHYKGLGANFRRGTIYCTPITAALVRQELRVASSHIREVPLGSPVDVEGVRVTFLEANHCPGAAMILFEPSGSPPVLQTGDCRCSPDMEQEPALQGVRGKVHLVLDATYAKSSYDFPPQEDAIAFVADAIRAESFNPRTLFLIGTYKIGKERLFLEVARRLEKKMYVSETKLKVLQTLSLPEEQMAWLTTDDRETNLHAVPMNKVTVKGVNSTAKWYRGRFQTVVAFKPTGWSMQRGKGRIAAGRRQQNGTVVTYQVPYSEHSSFKELKSFVSWLRPAVLALHSYSGTSEEACIESLIAKA